MKSAFDSVLEMAQAAILHGMGETPLTQDDIAAKVDMILTLPMGWQGLVDRDDVIKALEMRFSIWIGREGVLSNNDDHLPWITAERKQGWRYWPRYRQWLEARWSPVAVDALEKVTDTIVGLVEDPARPGAWDRRGLVVGHVQSGKTANYTGVVCKAADAGYKLIIILAGMHKNLRSQTQMRLDEGFLGYETMPTRAHGIELRTIGVGQIDSDPSIRPDYVTNRSDGGDFKKSVANSMGVSPGTRPWLFVVKKNASVLKNLLSWVEERVADTHDAKTGRPVVSGLPILVIDDEADHASVDTGEQTFDENGAPDPDYEPKTINRLIRRLLFVFDKAAYLGYTATPFANIFIHEQARTADHGDDLFPRSFIVNLPAPSNYAGPVRVFGLDAQDGDGGSPALPLARHVSDHAASLRLDEQQGWMPPLHKKDHVPLLNGIDELPASLKEAIHAFLLACAVRRLRAQGREHNSMLVHVTRYTNVQKAVTRQIDEYLTGIRRRLKRGTAGTGQLQELRRLWEGNFVPTTDAVRAETGDSDLSSPEWAEIENILPLVVDDIEVREINGTAKDILDYETHRLTGLSVIAVGGDKLARGLTLEGLTVSYFLRATKMYDTLMQMGRWFGYRPGYLDLCRLYTTPDLEEWFQHITEAGEELRQEFDHMVAIGGSPRDYGLKVRSHPVLMVTSKVKMRNSFELQLSLAGDIQETVVFHRADRILQQNLATTEALMRKLGKGIPNPKKSRPGGRKDQKWDGSFLWEDRPGADVVDFLRSFVTHEAAVKVNSKVMADYIERQQALGELTQWTVALLSGDGEEVALGDHKIDTVDRKPNVRCYTVQEQKQLGRYVIGRILAPRDEAIDLDAAEYAAALELTQQAYIADPGRSRRKTAPDEPSGQAIRRIRGKGKPEDGIVGHPERGLLLLYPLSPLKADIEFGGPIMGFGVSFPASDNARSVTYKVNNVYWQQEYGEGF